MECLDPWNYETGSCVWPEQFPTVLSAEKENQPRIINVAFNMISAVFGGGCEKYWTLKAINGLVIEIQLENPAECLGYRFVSIIADDINRLPKPNVSNQGCMLSNYMDGVTTAAAQMATIEDYSGRWETYVAATETSSRHLRGISTCW